MIPAYLEDIPIPTEKVPTSDVGLAVRISQLEEQVRSLSETVNFVNRERSRMKSDIDQLIAAISKR